MVAMSLIQLEGIFWNSSGYELVPPAEANSSTQGQAGTSPLGRAPGLWYLGAESYAGLSFAGFCRDLKGGH